MNAVRSPRNPAHRLITIVGLLLVALGTLPAHTAPVALAAAMVRYDPSRNTIYVGDNYSPSDPAQAPFIGYPSHPLAPKTSISIPELATALNNPILLNDQGGGIWLLKANVVISQTARLEATNGR